MLLQLPLCDPITVQCHSVPLMEQHVLVQMVLMSQMPVSATVKSVVLELGPGKHQTVGAWGLELPTVLHPAESMFVSFRVDLDLGVCLHSTCFTMDCGMRMRLLKSLIKPNKTVC